MADSGVGDYFITDVDSDSAGDEERMPLVVPVVERPADTSQGADEAAPRSATALAAPRSSLVSADATHMAAVPNQDPASGAGFLAPGQATDAPPGSRDESATARPEPQPASAAAAPQTQGPAVRVAPAEPSREELLVAALDELMDEDTDIQAAALVSLDGFTMASALPAEMQSDRVGAMSAAILALGERAAAELGRGQLSQVFIEGEDGYVFLVAAGSWAVLTAIADPSAKLGLVIYDMKKAAERVGRVLG